ncbi:MAG TPA: tRNA (adenosine(37)-N6)-dimethylallyltransferase MiaA [Thermoanaerobaculia bacterium]
MTDKQRPKTENGRSAGPIVVAGPTGVGKSDLALRLARELSGEIVNYDSVQIYRGFDIGSAKPAAETRALVPHHLYDVVDADEEFNAADYARLARPVLDEIVRRGNRPILVGGTFFYLRALLAGLPEMPGRDEAIRARISAVAERPRGPVWLHRWLSKVDPPSGNKIAPNDRHRVERALEVWLSSGRPISSWQRPRAGSGELPAVILGLNIERKKLVELLDRRTERMFAEGLVEETRTLLQRYPKKARPFGTIGYREAIAVLEGEMDTAAAITETARRTRAYAKRQMTWLRAEPDVQWLDASNRDDVFAAAMRLLRG